MSTDFGNSVALLVGISYAETDEKIKLPGAPKDAELMHKVLKEIGFKDNHIYHVPDNESTWVKFKFYLSCFYKNLKPNALGLFFFAGHGETDSYSRGVQLVLGHSSGRREMALAEIIEETLRAKARMVYLIDACCSGDIGGLICEQLQEQCHAVIAACRRDEEAHESDSGGFFTRRVASGLAGIGGKYDNGEVTIHHLLNYLNHEVPRDAEGRQHPYQWIRDGSGNLVVGRDLSRTFLDSLDKDQSLSSGIRTRVRRAFDD
jgi:hypothetical protein